MLVNILFALAWLALVGGIAGVRWELLPLGAGLRLVALAALALLVLGLGALVLAAVAAARGRPLVGARLVRGALGLVPMILLLVTVGPDGLRAPPIHDITTDTENPPAFVLAVADRGATDNPSAYRGEEIAAVQRQAYPDLAPLELAQAPDQVLAAARQVAVDMGWEVLGLRSEDGTLEVVARSALFGFEDDIAVRVVPHGEGSRVDVRSASRVGRGDLGANAKRIRAYIKALVTKV
jgi:uncharacterized protein (DUF1499 family)